MTAKNTTPADVNTKKTADNKPADETVTIPTQVTLASGEVVTEENEKDYESSKVEKLRGFFRKNKKVIISAALGLVVVAVSGGVAYKRNQLLEETEDVTPESDES